MCVLQKGEVVVVSRLNWRVAFVLPSDFLGPIPHALPFVGPLHLQNMCRHIHAYVALAAFGILHNNVTNAWDDFCAGLLSQFTIPAS